MYTLTQAVIDESVPIPTTQEEHNNTEAALEEYKGLLAANEKYSNEKHYLEAKEEALFWIKELEEALNQSSFKE